MTIYSKHSNINRHSAKMTNTEHTNSSELLRQCFPTIRSRDEVLTSIHVSNHLRATFEGWTPEQQEEFLDICTGVKGVKILYDAFFKEIMNPEYTPDRLSSFLSLVLRQKVEILEVLPNDSTRLGSESSLLITDIVVELEDHSIANVEVQKLGYYFPGQRSACYSADLLLRQYKRARDRKKQDGLRFSYRDIQNVYTIILFEQSPNEFHTEELQHTYLFPFSQSCNLRQGINIGMELLQYYYFIPLDNFKKYIHNKGINCKLDAWLVFLCIDEPPMILNLIEKYPEFKELYADVYEICRNTEAIMGLFSKELQILDENTVQYMIDDMQDQIDAQAAAIDILSEDNRKQASTIDQQAAAIQELQQLVKSLQGNVDV